MRVLIDANILISAALSNKWTSFAAFKKLNIKAVRETGRSSHKTQ